MDPIPLEQEFPQLAEHIQKIANRQHNTVKSINIDPAGSTIYLRNGQRKVVGLVQPYDPCWCGSSKKFKFCCRAKSYI